MRKKRGGTEKEQRRRRKEGARLSWSAARRLCGPCVPAWRKQARQGKGKRTHTLTVEVHTQKYATIPQAEVFIEHKNTLYTHPRDPVRHEKSARTQAPPGKCFDSEQQRTNLSGMFSPQLGAKQLWTHFLNLCPSFLIFDCLPFQSAFFFSAALNDFVFCTLKALAPLQGTSWDIQLTDCLWKSLQSFFPSFPPPPPSFFHFQSYPADVLLSFICPAPIVKRCFDSRQQRLSVSICVWVRK